MTWQSSKKWFVSVEKHEDAMKNYFITGTDTGVGKTFVTCTLLHLLQTRGVKVAPMKPVAAGTIDMDSHAINEDVAAMQAITQHRFAVNDVNPYCMREAIAPHLAAAHENIVIDPGMIAAAFDRLSAFSDCVLVEGAGGLLVPLNATHSMADIPALLRLEVILVVGMRLGCLNHALLTAEAIRARGYRLAGWVANIVSAPQMARLDENIATLRSMMLAPWLGTIPYIVPSANMIAPFSLAATHLHIDSLF